MKQFVSPLLAFGCLIGNVAAAWPNGPFKTSGRWIVNANDEKVNLAGANWPGHGEVMVPEGLQYQSIKDVLSDIKGIGMNAIRLTFATEMVDQIYANDGKDIDIKTAFEEGLGKENGTIVLEKVLKNNPSFTPETTRLEVYDAIAAECLRQEIYINLDNHISEGKWCCGGDDLNTWWGDSQFDTEKWVRGGAYMAAHAKKWPAKVSQSLRNEPREPTNNAKLKEESYHWSDLYKYMRQGADAVHEADPEAIIVISGMNYDTYVTPLYSGEKMEPRGEVFNRDDFKGYGKDKLVLEIHTYENKGTSCPSLRYNLYNKGFQAMNESDPNVAEVFPVMLTEFGQAMNGPDYETAKTYVSCLSEYLPEIQASWFIWVIVGRYYTRQGTQEFDDSWGMKKPDWSGWRNDEYIETYLKPQIEDTALIKDLYLAYSGSLSCITQPHFPNSLIPSLNFLDLVINAKVVVMSLVLRQAGSLKPEIRLAQAVSEFEATLTPEQKSSFQASRARAVSTTPTMSDVMRLTAEIDLKATSKHGRGRCFGPRMTNTLQAIQQFAALGDIIVGGGQNLIACGVWAAARMTLHVITGYFTYLENLSLLFMSIGRNAPRYQSMASLYPKSKSLQRYLCEYFIVITKLCHQSVAWTMKPILSRLSSTISDPQMKAFKDDLDVWSSAIKEEANVLLNQQVTEEAKRNSIFRALAKSRHDTYAHQQKTEQRARFLDACSQYDYRKTWKQNRKCGTTMILTTCRPYQQWKDDSGKTSILLLGKLGAGKSVLLANIVDDLNLNNHTITLYFFSRHDSEESLKAKTIFGALTRQLLEHVIYDTAFSHLFPDTVPQLDLDDIIELLRLAKPKNKAVFIVLDGLDECERNVQRIVLENVTKIQAFGYAFCLSVRTFEQGPIWDTRPFHHRISIPEQNPDIPDFVETEVDIRVREGSLVTRDPNLVEEVKKELIAGACGMFLWVSLQLDSICAEVSDHDVREAIRDLPRDLTETYKRNVAKASLKDYKRHHVRIFKFLVSAREPLTAEQLRQAASVTIGQTAWSSDGEINSIYSILKFCGSLVMIDEEEDTVRFIHHSARSFCTEKANDVTDWPFSDKQANRHMAETLVTFLSYNVFETTISRNVVPKIDATQIPKKVVLDAVTPFRIGTSFSEKVLRYRSRSKLDIGPTLASARRHQPQSGDQFPLLIYATKYWVRHTAHLEDLFSLPEWHSLLRHPSFGIDCAYFPDQMIGPLRPIKAQYRDLYWALSNGHILTLRTAVKQVDILAMCALVRSDYTYESALAPLESQSNDGSSYCPFVPPILIAASSKFRWWKESSIRDHCNGVWLFDVTSWLLQMDSTYYKWCMEENGPVSFARAFEGLDKAGVPSREIKVLQNVLDITRDRLLIQGTVRPTPNEEKWVRAYREGYYSESISDTKRRFGMGVKRK
ncbi:vegetative incompatibility protein het-e-1 [Fusarium flagelliforme]|uniref:Vegetative incompatibility protein het-e-1 n=1 Tax=Fusarium flagelliforme TaxID=2675880 RepID=A0A395N2W5_9HYPO|nr:vegetative incompatibility protein het-e-1 [Fusarium flagelliforme]